MSDILTEMYYLIDESLPSQKHPVFAERALLASLTPEQQKLFDDYIAEEALREDAERLRLFRCLIKLGLHIPGG